MSLNKTKIEWVKSPDGSKGMSWNPITGALGDCPNLNARKLANTRLKERYLANGNLVGGYVSARGALKEGAIPPNLDPFYPRFWEDRFEVMKKRFVQLHSSITAHPKKLGIFTCDMSDLFGIGVPEVWTRLVLEAIRINAYDRFYLLTKQPQNLIKFSPFPDNCWVGVTATNGNTLINAMYYLKMVDAKVKYISFEPLLAHTLFDNKKAKDKFDFQKCVDWVIIGAQTKPYKPPKIEWVREIVSACDKAGIPVFLKDNLKPLLGRDYSKGIKGYAPMWAYKNQKLRQELPHKERAR